ncbi:MAG TPA: ABC transporter permease [Anaerolineales bacterium]|nr:ABC transporter permease [Anaerolineales bacterium]
MTQFIIRRLLLLFPVLIGILFVTFVIVHLIPGDPCVAMLGERATPAACQAFRARFGLDQPLLIQFGNYLINMAQGNLGNSIRFGRPVVDIISERLPMTIELTICAMLFSTIIGIPLGIVSAVRRGRWMDTFTMIWANVGVSMPVFWLGLMLAYVFALLLKGTPFFIPPSGRFSSGISLEPLATIWGVQNWTGFPRFIVNLLSNMVLVNSAFTGNWLQFKDELWHLILPAVAVGTIPLAIIARMTRSSLLEVLGLDYIRTARAKGLEYRVVILKHALRNALIPIVTIIGLETGGLLSGAILTETVFLLPGVGTQLVAAILARDYPVVQGFTIVIAVIFVLVNLIVDLSYAYLDPRIRLQ